MPNQQRGRGGRGGAPGRGGGRGGTNNAGRGQAQQAKANNGPKPTSQLTMAFLQMYRTAGAAQTVADLRNRTNEYAVVPSSQKAVVAVALSMLGAVGTFVPKESIQLKAVIPADAAAANHYTVLTSSVALAPGISSAEKPPTGVIGVVKRATGLKWVISTHAPNSPPTALTWAQTNDDTKVFAGELANMDYSWSGTVACIDKTGNFSAVDCGVSVHNELKAALGGNAAAIVRCAMMFAGDTYIGPPPASLQDGKPTRAALISFISWLSTAVASAQIAPASAVEMRMQWQ